MTPSRRLANQFGPLLATLIFLLIGVGVYLCANSFSKDAEWVSHTNEVIAQIGKADAALRDTEAAQRGFLLTNRVEYLADYRNARQQLPSFVALLCQLVEDNPAQLANCQTLQTSVKIRLMQMEKNLQVYQAQGLAHAQAVIGSDVLRVSNDVRSMVQQMSAVEQELLLQRAASSRISANLLRGLALLGIPFGIAVIAMVYGLLRQENRRRARAEKEAGHANESLRSSIGELEGRSADLHELGNYASMLQSCMRGEEAMALASDLLQRLLPGTAGSIYRIRASRDYAEEVIQWGVAAAVSPQMLAHEDCWALRRGRPHAWRQGAGSGCAHVQHTGSGSGDLHTLCIPMVAQGVQLGFLYLSSPRGDFMARVELIETAVEQLAMALSNLSLQETLRVQSIRDPMTGLFNRRYLEESLGRELARCQRRSLPLAVLMLDLDHFKRFNDQHGHAGGDILLTDFGGLLQRMSRAEDIACRYGGEEFTLILPEATAAVAAVRAEEIRAAVEGMRVQYLGRELHDVTVSVGVAAMPEHGSDPELLLRCADEALYRAKREGRNRVAGAGEA